MTMDLPEKAGFMVLSGVTLFPRQMLPLHIFEPRYRQMLDEALDGHRLFGVALRQEDSLDETPHGIAGLGLVKVSVQQPGGTSNLILVGVGRVKLLKRDESKPYPCYEIERLCPQIEDEEAFERSIDRLHAMMERILDEGVLACMPDAIDGDCEEGQMLLKSMEMLKRRIDAEEDPERLIDVVACAFLNDPEQKQSILGAESLDLRLERTVELLKKRLGDCEG